MTLKIALYQCPCSPPDSTKCTAVITDVIAQAAQHGTHLVMFPELMFGGYTAGGDNMRRIAQTRDSESMRMISKCCADHHIAACVPYPELDNNVLYNSMIIFDDDGREIANYRKTHLWAQYEKAIFTAGADFVKPFTLRALPHIRISCLICYDVEFPECVRTLAYDGVQVILVPTALVNPFNALVTVPGRAFESQVFVCYCNFSDDKFCGRSVVAAPDGTELARAGPLETGLKYAVINPESPDYADCRARNPYYEDIRHELYHHK